MCGKNKRTPETIETTKTDYEWNCTFKTEIT